jgi:hypothetical protein
LLTNIGILLTSCIRSPITMYSIEERKHISKIFSKYSFLTKMTIPDEREIIIRFIYRQKWYYLQP